MTMLQRMSALALEYKASTGKPLGITGELGELIAAETLGLTLAPARQAGWDAIDANGRRFQIKSRVCDRRGMMPSVNLKHQFDALLLVVIDPTTLLLAGIYEMDRAQVEASLARPGSRARSERNALAVPWFISNGKKIA